MVLISYRKTRWQKRARVHLEIRKITLCMDLWEILYIMEFLMILIVVLKNTNGMGNISQVTL